MRFVTNYTKGWTGPDLQYEDFRGKVTKEGHRLTLSELLEPDDIIKPYVDVDKKVPTEQFEAENKRIMCL